MSYINLPPGRERRLTYSRELQQYRYRHDRYQDQHQYYEILSELENVKCGLISKNLLNKSKICSKYNTFCSICQEENDENICEIVRILNCKHAFHIDCIDTWFTEHNKCPECRFEI